LAELRREINAVVVIVEREELKFLLGEYENSSC